jgi:glycosyltransferase involved in cell wall biosynthesis
MIPKITILLSTHNRAHLIQEALHSIQNQTYSDFECLVTDDNSKDATEQVVKVFCERDQRFNYLKKPFNYTAGLSANRNFGLDNAKGLFIVFCDDDDIMHPQHLEMCMNFLEDLEVDFVHFRKQSFTDQIPQNNVISVTDLNKNKIDKKDINDVIFQKIALASCTVMWKKEAIGKARFVSDLNYAEEWEFYTRLILNGAKGVEIDVILYFNRKHPNSNTGEFYAGNKNRMHSKIEASKLIISNLNQKNLLSPELIHFFCWESFRFRSPELLQHLRQQSSLSSFQKAEVFLKYNLGPITQFLMRLKKRFK